MSRFLSHRLIAFIFIASTLIPQKTLSNPLYDEGNWRAMSDYTRPILAARSSGIGGLQADINNSRTLVLEPSAISYSGGHLRVKIEGEQRTVKVSPKIVQEAIGIVEKTDNKVFQTSIDRTALGNYNYIDEELQNTEIGERLLDGDLSFAAIVQGEVPFPKQGLTHPYKESLRLLNTDDEYRNLTTQWESPPRSWPQIYLYFNPKVPGLISLEFKPQVLFYSPFGLPLEVDKKVQDLGERPYLPLMKDVKERPLDYRAISPELDRAAEITATLGLLEAACKKPDSCRDLYSQAASISNETSESKTNDQQRVKTDIISWRKEMNASEKELDKAWERLNLSVFQPGNTPQAWATAYDVLQKAIRKAIRKEISGAYEDLNQVEQLKDLAAKQFLNYKVPNDSLLQAALAVIYYWDGKKALAEQKLNQAIQLSADHPRDRIQVLKMVTLGYIFYPGNSQPERSIQNLSSLMNQARIDAYDEVDKYLQSCVEKLGSCAEEDLRRWEAEAFRARLTGNMQTRDLAWLHGRFAYLVGIQLKDPVKQKDRLRFLSFYAQKAQEEHLSKLDDFKTDLKKRLETDSHGWIKVVVIAVVFTFSCLMVQKIIRWRIDEMRH